jgi:hypothetical protein
LTARAKGAGIVHRGFVFVAHFTGPRKVVVDQFVRIPVIGFKTSTNRAQAGVYQTRLLCPDWAAHATATDGAADNQMRASAGGLTVVEMY